VDTGGTGPYGHGGVAPYVPGDVNAVMMNGAGAPLKLSFDPQSHLPGRVDNYVFANHRDVAALMVPFRIQLMAGRTVIETWDVKEFKIDEPIPPSAFRRSGRPASPAPVGAIRQVGDDERE